MQIFSASIIQKEELVKGEIFNITFGMKDPIVGVQRFYANVATFGRHYLLYHKD